MIYNRLAQLSRCRLGHRFFSSRCSPLKVGLCKETYNIWESRAPLTPAQVEDLLADPDYGISVCVQPSVQRIFTNDAYARAGATLVESLADVDVIIGVKRPKDSATLLPNHTYLFFSHTIKGQAENMELLQTCLDKKIQLFDYERMVENTLQRPKRLVAFGKFAGIAGAIDSFHALGRRLLHRDGATTPFLACPMALMNNNLDQAKERIRQMGDRILEGMGITEPLVLCVTGKGGAVHGGVMEILQLLPHEIISVEDLPRLYETLSASRDAVSPQRQVYLCPVGLSDVFQHRTNPGPFDRDHFQNHPGEYRSLFASRVVPYVHGIYNAVYWDPRFPRLLTKEQMKKIVQRGNERLLLLADITCDPKGSIEFLDRVTHIESPFFQYDPISKKEVAPEIGTTGITVLGVDILPSELPRESSEHFGNAVVQVIKTMASVKQRQDASKKGIDTSLLPPGLATSCITTSEGNLADQYHYLSAVLESNAHKKQSSRSMVLSIDGHLFDSGLINQIADVIEKHSCGLAFRRCIFPADAIKGVTMSSVVMEVSGLNEEVLNTVEKKIASLVELIEKGEAIMTRLDRKNAPAQVEDQVKAQQVLLLGAGRMAKTCVSRLGRQKNVKVTIVTNSDKEGKDVASASERATFVNFDIMKDLHALSDMIDDSDLVISLLPAPMHPVVAAECLAHKKNFLTASYESDEIRALRDRAEAAGIIMLNEVGLDPGLDHMSAMKIIDDIKARDGHIHLFTSSCGGLPSPEAADNPLKYKFSWSPMGVIRASCNDAQYRWNGKVENVPGSMLLNSAMPFQNCWSDLDLEVLPNRNSLHYEKVYGIEGADTIFRGTLRYRGFSRVLQAFKEIGFFQPHHTDAPSWGELLKELSETSGDFVSVADYVHACSSKSNDLTSEVMNALNWLGLNGDTPLSKNSSIVESFCNVLQERLAFKDGEHDMVVMHHMIEASFDDGMIERHQSSLKVFGDSQGSAMAKTVGYTTAVAAELMLDGTLREHRGLLLPTDPRIYKPALEKMAEDGILFHETSVSTPAPARRVAN